MSRTRAGVVVAVAAVAAWWTLAPETGNTHFFSNVTYDHQVLRVLNAIPAGGADTGEVLEAIRPIRQGDEQSWYAGWNAAAEGASARAAATNDARSKGLALLRAHGYWRTAEVLLPPDDPKRPDTFRRQLAAFYGGLDALGVAYEVLRVPYGDATLKAVYYPAPPDASPRPLIVFHGGIDSMLEELYAILGADAHERGYAVLTFEGPGQGSVLREQGLTFTPEWEKPTGAVLDAFLASHPAPPKIVLIGMSLGGYLAPRAAAFDRRIDGVVAFDVFYDGREITRRTVPGAGAWLVDHGFDRTVAVLARLRAAMNPGFRWAMRHGEWVLGPGDDGPAATLRAMDPYTLEGVAPKITADVLIFAGANDHFVPVSQVARFQRALTGARSVTTHVYEQESGGAEHSQMGASTLWHQDFFDWMTARFPSG